MSYQTIISVAELNKHLNDQDLLIFDCRFLLKDPNGGLTKFKQGHIPGAQFADMDTDLSSPMTDTSGRHPLPNPKELKRKLCLWGVNNSSQVVCYDDMSGAFAARMWWLLKWLGHEDVAVLDGGIDKWMEAGLPVTSETLDRATGNFDGQPNTEMWVDIDFVQQQLAQNKINLIDARSRERFTAKDTKTDPVAGHVPGALNFPFAENLSKQGLFLAPDELRNRFSKVVQQDQKQVINMCGSGVTACHNLLAMRIAGLPMSRLYVGSWSEWIKEKSRPVATGEK